MKALLLLGVALMYGCVDHRYLDPGPPMDNIQDPQKACIAGKVESGPDRFTVDVLTDSGISTHDDIPPLIVEFIEDTLEPCP